MKRLFACFLLVSVTSLSLLGCGQSQKQKSQAPGKTIPLAPTSKIPQALKPGQGIKPAPLAGAATHQAPQVDAQGKPILGSQANPNNLGLNPYGAAPLSDSSARTKSNQDIAQQFSGNSAGSIPVSQIANGLAHIPTPAVAGGCQRLAHPETKAVEDLLPVALSCSSGTQRMLASVSDSSGANMMIYRDAGYGAVTDISGLQLWLDNNFFTYRNQDKNCFTSQAFPGLSAKDTLFQLRGQVSGLVFDSFLPKDGQVSRSGNGFSISSASDNLTLDNNLRITGGQKGSLQLRVTYPNSLSHIPAPKVNC